MVPDDPPARSQLRGVPGSWRSSALCTCSQWVLEVQALAYQSEAATLLCALSTTRLGVKGACGEVNSTQLCTPIPPAGFVSVLMWGRELALPARLRLGQQRVASAPVPGHATARDPVFLKQQPKWSRSLGHCIPFPTPNPPSSSFTAAWLGGGVRIATERVLFLCTRTRAHMGLCVCVLTHIRGPPLKKVPPSSLCRGAGPRSAELIGAWAVAQCLRSCFPLGHPPPSSRE